MFFLNIFPSTTSDYPRMDAINKYRASLKDSVKNPTAWLIGIIKDHGRPADCHPFLGKPCLCSFSHLSGEGHQILSELLPPPSFLLLQLLNFELQTAVGTAGPQPRAPDLNKHRRTGTAAARSQCALPGVNRKLQISVGTAGPQPRTPEISVGTAGSHPRGPRAINQAPDIRTSTASSRSQWAPDINRERQISVTAPQPRAQDLSGHYRTPTARARSQCGLLDPNYERQIKLNCGTSIASAICQMECQKRCQIECLKECQRERESIRIDVR